jgi:hypothetical protein
LNLLNVTVIIALGHRPAFLSWLTSRITKMEADDGRFLQATYLQKFLYAIILPAKRRVRLEEATLRQLRATPWVKED